MAIESRWLDYDPLTGIRETFHYDHATGEQTITYEQDVEPIIEMNKALANEQDGMRWGDGRTVARLPAIVLHQMQKDGTLGSIDPMSGMVQVFDQQKLLKWLDDPAHKAFRSFNGSLSR